MMTTQKQIRAAFWQSHPDANRRRFLISTGREGVTAELTYSTDTRCAFADFIDYLHRDGQISDALAARVTL